MTKEEATEKYRNNDYSCAGYFCTVATTCYEPEEQERICVRCIMERESRHEVS